MSSGIPQFERDDDGEKELKSHVTYFDSEGRVTYQNGGHLDAPPNAHLVMGVPRSHEEDDEDSEDHRCGLGCCSPPWLQVFASKKAFMVVFSFLALVQGMGWSYFTATITTLEKRFKISSQTAGIMMTGNEVSQILFSLVLSHYLSRRHRPRWIAVGILISACACFVLASPHLLYGPGSDALSLTAEHAADYDPDYLDKFPTTVSSLFKNDSADPPKAPNPFGRAQRGCRRELDRSTGLSDCEAADTSLAPLFLIFTSQFLSGIGVLLFYTLGGPYLDDNIEKTKSPMVFGVTMSLRLVGPTLGFLFAGSCLKMYISPTLTPLINNKDPRWLGAWWIGHMGLGTVMFLTSGVIALFPRVLPRTIVREKIKSNMKGSSTSLAHMGSQIVYTAEKVADQALPSITDMPRAVSVLLKNKINRYNNLAAIFYLFSAIGYWTYMPKYLETTFMQTAVSASVISGLISIAFQAIGLLLSGYFISKYQPGARKLAAWNVFIGVMYVLVKISFTQMGCEPGNIAFGEKNEATGTWNLTTECNADCNCKVNKIQPICHKETNEIYYSACHAGCTIFSNGSIGQCSCISDPMATVTLGTCNEGCLTVFLIFLGVNAFIKLIDSSGRIGNMLVSYRCVDPKDKGLSIGLSIFLISIFAMLPSPILFGKIFDMSCLVWGSKCGAQGNCWLYEGPRLRYWFNLTAAGFTFLGAFFDFLVWYYVKDLDLYDEDKNVKNRLKEEYRKSQKPR